MTECTFKVEQKESSVIFKIKAIPSASKNKIGPLYGEYLKIFVTQPPENGKANYAIKKLLADMLQVPTIDLEIVSGAASKNKEILVEGVDKNYVIKCITGVI